MKLRRTPLTLRALALYAVAGCCVLSLIIGAMQSAGQALGILPTPTPQPPTATPGPANTTEPTATPRPSATPEPTRTPVPTQTPDPTRTPNPTAAAIATQASIGVRPQGGACPSEAPIKGNVRDREPDKGAKIYHLPGGASYDVTDPERCFVSEADAQAAGYRRSER